MDNPYAPPSEADAESWAGESPRLTPHWLWKAYAIAFVLYAAYDTATRWGWMLRPEAFGRQVILILASCGVLAYAFSKKILRRWVWSQLAWLFPVAELVYYTVEVAALSRALERMPTVHVAWGLPSTIAFLPFSALAMHRYGRSRAWG